MVSLHALGVLLQGGGSPVQPFEWFRVFVTTDETTPGFFWEILLRSFVMFGVLLLCLRLLGRRGVKQLSLFELAIIIGMGSAAGDPMLYHDVPLLHGVLVVFTITLLYRGVVGLIARHPRFERFVAGKSYLLYVNQTLDHASLPKIQLSFDELMEMLRQEHVTHLGQVDRMYLENDGELSVFFLPDAEVQPGLPTWPEILGNPMYDFPTPGSYACMQCAQVQQWPAGAGKPCPHCGHRRWLETRAELRIA